MVTYAFLWEKVKTVDFSETIAACDLKVGRCRQLIMSPPEGLGDILFFPGRPSVQMSAETDVYLCVLNHGHLTLISMRFIP